MRACVTLIETHSQVGLPATAKNTSMLLCLGVLTHMPRRTHETKYTHMRAHACLRVNKSIRTNKNNRIGVRLLKLKKNETLERNTKSSSFCKCKNIDIIFKPRLVWFV